MAEQDLNNIRDVNEEYNKLKATLSNLISDQGDLDGLLLNQVKTANGLEKAFSKIASRIYAIKNTTIDVKAVEKEYLKSVEKEYTAKKNLQDIQNNLNTVAKQRLQSEEDLTAELQRALQTGEDREKLEKRLRDLAQEIGGDIQIQALRTAEKILSITKKNVEQTENELKLEKQLDERRNKALGISGSLLGGIAKNLGLGASVFGDMNTKAEKYAKQSGEITSKQKWDVFKTGLKGIKSGLLEGLKDPLGKITVVGVGIMAIKKGFDLMVAAAKKFGETMAGFSKHTGDTVRGLTSGVSSLAKNIPMVGGLVSGLIDGFSAILDLALGIDNYITKAGRQLSMTKEEARGLYRAFSSSETSLGNIYVTAEKLLDSQLELSKQLGVVNILSEEQLATNIKLKEFADLEEGSRAAIAQSSIITGKSSEATVKAIIGQVAGLKNATGIAFQYQAIISEAANLGGYLGLQFAKYPGQLTNSLLITKALGTSLKEMDSIASSFLDFESSISKEFEAQILTGKDLNLNRARALFLENDLAGAAQEINRQLGSSDDFLKLNRIQAESVAEAFGMSRDSMAQMLKTQEMLVKLGAKDTDSATKRLDLARMRFGEEVKINEALGEGAYQQLVTASTQEKLALGIEKIKQSLVEFIEKTGLIDKVTNLINKLSDTETVKKTIGTIIGYAAEIVKILVQAADAVTLGLGVKEKWQRQFESDLDKAVATFNTPTTNVGATKANMEKTQTTRTVQQIQQIQQTQSAQTNTDRSTVLQSNLYVDGQKLSVANTLGGDRNANVDTTNKRFSVG